MDTVNDDQLLHAHQEMWHSFTRFLGYAAGAVAAVLVLMALFLL
jgi:tetrahydromethanopterin S-methyltransferase subunit F